MNGVCQFVLGLVTSLLELDISSCFMVKREDFPLGIWFSGVPRDSPYSHSISGFSLDDLT